MAKKTKSKTAGANMPVPQNRDEAAAYVKIIGELQRDIGRFEADMNDEMAKVKERFEKLAAPRAEEVKVMTEGLRMWAEANRTVLTNDNKVKFANLGTGEIEWRLNPPKVSIRDADNVIKQCEAKGLTSFLRVKTEVNKEAMLADPLKTKLLSGVTIGTSGEAFIVKPFEIELEGAKQ
eukprot:gene7629-7693_t